MPPRADGHSDAHPHPDLAADSDRVAIAYTDTDGYECAELNGDGVTDAHFDRDGDIDGHTDGDTAGGLGDCL